MTVLYPAILALFFLSGASALAYEALWQRQMVLIFGASAPATTAVLTSFFCGIAFGSLIGGRILKGRANALMFYAAVELWIGVCAVLLPFLLQGVDGLYMALSQAWAGDSQGTMLSFAARFSMAVGVVLPATLGMGATIPAMNRILDEMRKRSIGVNVGLAYGVNTLGAVFGGLLTGFVLIKSFGVRNSMYIALCMNALVFLGALLLSRIFTFTTPVHAAEKLPRTFFWLVLIYFGSSFLALGYEVVWLRILGILATNGIYTFVLALAIYLLGFSLGSLLLFRLLAEKLSALKIFFLATIGAGASALACVSLAYILPPVIKGQLLRIVGEGSLNLGHLTFFESVYAVSLMFLPAMFMGLAYPAVCQRLIEHKENVAEQSGSIYFIGNIGAMLGIFCTGLLVIPALGLTATLAAFSAASAVLAALIVVVYPATFPVRKIYGYTGCALILALSLLYAAIAPPILRYGNARYDSATQKWQEGPMTRGAKETNILRYKAGASGTIIVKEERYSRTADFARRLYVDDLAVASTVPEAVIDAKMLAHIPLFLHPAPSSALTVGFGSGGTSYSMTLHGVETYAVEIEPEVVHSAQYFLQQNHDVMKSGRFHLMLNDARDHLHTTRRKYDVISTDVTNLQYKQNASLYSREYFRLMKLSLAGGGIACAWIPIKSIDEADLRILMRTFQSVFPYASLWYMDHAETSFGILIGTPGPLQFDVRRFEQAYALPAVGRDLRQVGIEDPAQIMSFMYLDHKEYRAYVGAGPLHTDDRPVLEFSSPVSFYSGGVPLYSLTEKWNSLRTRSFLPLVINATEEERSAYARDEKFYRILGSLNRREFLKKDSRDNRLHDLEEGIRLLDDALKLRPDDPRASGIKEGFEQELKLLRMMPHGGHSPGGYRRTQ